MKGRDIAEKFLNYFEGRGHIRLPSSSLIPTDPSVLLTLAGMLQFKPIFLGQEPPTYPRVTTVQKCVRTNDIEQVGKTARHHTFFEMLGNFSFGDYFKKDAVNFAWELLHQEFNIPKDRMRIAVFKDDDETFKIWEKDIGIARNQIFRLDEENNFWAAGSTGPCGPCSEIYYDMGATFGCGKPDCKPGCDCDRYLEIWNLVFIEFNRDEAGKLNPLPKKNIDTGMGLERVAAVLQGKHSNFDTDLLLPLINEAAALTRKKYGQDKKIDQHLRVLADHARAITHLLADGILPSNEGRGYVLRRILRRAICSARQLGSRNPFLYKLSEVVSKLNGEVYPEVKDRTLQIVQVIKSEEEQFLTTVEQGIRILDGMLVHYKGKNIIPGSEVFKLYDTYGFPYELTAEIAGDSGFVIEHEGFIEALEQQRERARSAGLKEESRARGSGGESIIAKSDYEKINMARHHTATHLLQAALRQVLGKEVFQSGSLVDPNYLRFDFSYNGTPSEDQLKKVEAIVNQKILEDLEVKKTETSFEEAKKMGAMALFGEKYGERVRVVAVEGFSRELCGGGHVDRTGQIGLFKIVSEGAIAAGVRRISALAGEKAIAYVNKNEDILKSVVNILPGSVSQLPDKVKRMSAELKELQKKTEKLFAKSAASKTEDILSAAEEVGGVKLLMARLEGYKIDALRVMLDKARQKLKSVLVVFASVVDDKVIWVAAATDDLVKKGMHAGKIVSAAAQVTGGRGGGKPELGQGGGIEVGKIDEAFTKIKELLR